MIVKNDMKKVTLLIPVYNLSDVPPRSQKLSSRKEAALWHLFCLAKIHSGQCSLYLGICIEKSDFINSVTVQARINNTYADHIKTANVG